MRDPQRPREAGALVRGLLAGVLVAGATAPEAALAADGGYLRIVAVAPGYDPGSAVTDRWIVYLDGFIDRGAAARFSGLLARKDIRSATIYLDSPGGHLVEAMALGRAIRQHGFDAIVGARSSDTVRPAAGLCFSACPFALAGGVGRLAEPGSMIGLHRAENSSPVPDEAGFQGVVAGHARDYLASMGVDARLVDLMAGTPHDSIRDVTLAEAIEYRLLTSRGEPDAP